MVDTSRTVISIAIAAIVIAVVSIALSFAIVQGQLGPAATPGPPGLQGPRGLQGLQGPPGEISLYPRWTESLEIPTDAIRTVAIECNRGNNDMALSGGWWSTRNVNLDRMIVASYSGMASRDYSSSQWVIEMANTGTESIRITPFAVCMEVSE